MISYNQVEFDNIAKAMFEKQPTSIKKIVITRYNLKSEHRIHNPIN